MNDLEKYDRILRHMKMVESHMQRLARVLYNEDPEKNRYLVREIMYRSRSHDLSKLRDLEFDHLWEGNQHFRMAIKSHHKRNDHHPEHFDSIHKMDDDQVAEMVCDWLARSNEFGTDVRYWVETEATKKYSFDMADPIGIKIDYYLKRLVTEAFSKS